MIAVWAKIKNSFLSLSPTMVLHRKSTNHNGCGILCCYALQASHFGRGGRGGSRMRQPFAPELDFSCGGLGCSATDATGGPGRVCGRSTLSPFSEVHF